MSSVNRKSLQAVSKTLYLHMHIYTWVSDIKIHAKKEKRRLLH